MVHMLSTAKFTLFPQFGGDRNLLVSKEHPPGIHTTNGVEQAFMPAVQPNDRSGFSAAEVQAGQRNLQPGRLLGWLERLARDDRQRIEGCEVVP
jgi:hypothetical protein